MTATTSEVLPADALTPEEAIAWITEAFMKSVASITETGRRLVEAKAKVPHGHWGKVVEGLPFSDRTAKRLMQIAKLSGVRKHRATRRSAR